MPISDAKRKAIRKYDSKNYTTLGYKCRKADLDKIKKYADNQQIGSNSKLLHKCLMYCIDNNIDLSNYDSDDDNADT